MGKPKRERALADNEARAVTRTIRVSPQKLNLVAAMIRGKPVERALADLTFSRKRIAREVKKTLQSAIANAEATQNVDVDRLYVKRATVDEGRSQKRFLPRAHGRATQIIKRSSHVTIVVDERPDGKQDT